jgi:hypothetical protein
VHNREKVEAGLLDRFLQHRSWPNASLASQEQWPTPCDAPPGPASKRIAPGANWMANLVSARDRARIDALQRQCERLNQAVVRQTTEIAVIRERCETLSTQPYVVTVTTFAPEPYDLDRPISIVVRDHGDCFTASFVEANINASGETEHEALEMVKDTILSAFVWLTSIADKKLGPGPLKQKHVLNTLIREKMMANG